MKLNFKDKTIQGMANTMIYVIDELNKVLGENDLNFNQCLAKIRKLKKAK